MITAKQKRYLRSLAHDRKVIVQTGAAGLSDAVLAEIGIALGAHELIKVRLVSDNHEARAKMIDDICNRHGAEQIQRIGHVVTIYRRNDESPGIVLP